MMSKDIRILLCCDIKTIKSTFKRLTKDFKGTDPQTYRQGTYEQYQLFNKL